MPPADHAPSGDPEAEEIESRKADHLRLAANADVDTRVGPGWADVHLLHEALPEVDLDAVDLSVDLLGRRLSAPLVIAAMTGGHALAHRVNAVLARAAERHRIGMGVGSQRAGLRNPQLASTYSVVRQEAPRAFIIANLGAPQLIAQRGGEVLGLAEARTAIDMVRADALAVHLNFLQEAVQPEGDRQAEGCAEAIRGLVGRVGVPLIAKETGAGMARSTALRLRDLGVAAIDVGALGGTTFAAVEGLRAEARQDARGQRLGALLRDWGVPTAVSVVAARPTRLPIIATGGVRSGLDAAKALALGARAVGVARPLLQAALEGDAAADAWIDQFLHELRTVLFLTGSRSVGELQQRPRVVLGPTRAWLEQLGYLDAARDDHHAPAAARAGLGVWPGDGL